MSSETASAFMRVAFIRGARNLRDANSSASATGALHSAATASLQSIASRQTAATPSTM